jgi:uncharacterized membrane protein YoaK (UPF0700 family)
MKQSGGMAAIGGLLAFNGGLVDTAGFLGVHGLFAAHVTGNLATLCAAVVLGSQGLIGKILAVPEFIAVVALARLADAAMRTRQWPARNILLGLEIVLLAAFLALGLRYGPFSNFDSALALLTAFTAIAAMAVQNDMQRVHLPKVPATTFMTGNVTNATVGLLDLLTGDTPKSTEPARARLGRMTINLACFAAGCAVSALFYWAAGFWCLTAPLAVAIAAAVLIHAVSDGAAR